MSKLVAQSGGCGGGCIAGIVVGVVLFLLLVVIVIVVIVIIVKWRLYCKLKPTEILIHLVLSDLEAVLRLKYTTIMSRILLQT